MAMATKKACLISTGLSWNAYGAGTLERLNNNYDIVIGSLISPFVALKEWVLIKEVFTNLSTYDIWDKYWYKSTPFNNDGNLRILPIIISLILGQKSIGTTNIIRKNIDNIFTENLFKELKKQNKEVQIGIQNYAQVPSKIHYFSSVNMNFEDFKDWMWCSVNFPVLTSLVKKSWIDNNGNFHIGIWSAGSITDLVGMDQLKGKGFKEIDIILHRPKNTNRFEGRKIKNIIDNVMASADAMQYDIDFNNFYDKITELNKEGAKVTVYWLPRKLSKNNFVFNHEEMLAWWNEGYDTAFDENRKEVFEPIDW